MKIIAVSLLAISLGLASMSASNAMPVVPLDQAVAAGTATIPVAGGCGPGWHSGPFGRRCFRSW